MELATGLRGRAHRFVTEDVTAIALKSGNVSVLGTPAVLALMEEAACDALKGELPDHLTSVGVWVQLEHLAPSELGAEVIATAELSRVDGGKLNFTCEATDDGKVIARAQHRRAVVDRRSFPRRV